jgi:hypothetical protein
MMLDTSREGRDRRLTSRAYWLAGAAGALWVLGGTIAFVTYCWYKAPRNSEVHSLPYVPSSRYRLNATDEKNVALKLPPFLEKKITMEAQGERSLSDWIAILRNQNVNVCFEACRTSLAEPDHEFAVRFENAPLHEVLEACVLFDSRYRWEVWEEKEIVNVIPKKSRLDARVGDISFRSRTLISCVEEPALRDEAKLFRGIWVGPRGPTAMMNWPFNIDARGASARDFLNLMVAQYEGMTWHITRAGAIGFYMPDKAADAVRESIRANLPESRSQ